MSRNDLNGGQLQSGRRLGPALVLGGVVSLAVLIGLIVTSLMRAPNPAFTWLLVGVAVILAVALVVNGRRYWSGGRR